MTRTLVLTIFALAACEKTEVKVATASPPPVVAVAPPVAAPAKPAPSKGRVDSIGGSQIAVPLGGDQAPLGLPFKIVKSYPNQQPSETAPYHSDGGNWLFFDAQTEGATPARFTFGMQDVKPMGDLPIAFAACQFSAADRASATALVDALAGGFKEKAPTAAGERPLLPLKLRLVVLGKGVTRLSNGGFQGIGNWTSTKVFAQLERLEGEVFFNFSPASGKGEFSEKDSSYNKDVVAVFAALRDGLPQAKKPR